MSAYFHRRHVFQSFLVLAAVFASTAALSGEVLFTFDEDEEGFEDVDGTAVWSDKYGEGALEITTANAWQLAAHFGFGSGDGAVWDEMQVIMVNGGSLTFEVIVDDAGLPDGSIGLWLAANSDDTQGGGGWNQMTPLTVTREEVDNGGGVAAFTVSVPILPEQTGGALHFEPQSEWFQIFLGRTDGSADGETVYYLDNFELSARDEPLEPPKPLGPFDPVVSTFDLAAEGFQRANGDEVAGTSVGWSDDFGGSVRVVKGDNGDLEYERIAEMNVAEWGNSRLLPAMRQAGVLGGFLEMDVVFPAGAIGFDADPGFDLWVQFKNADIAVGEFPEWGAQRFVAEILGAGETPTTDERRATVRIPIVPGDDATSYADQDLPLVSAFKLAPEHSHYLVEVGAAQGAAGEVAFHIDNVSVVPAAPAGTIVFDDDTEGFEPAGSADVDFDSAYGGSLRIELPGTSGSETMEAAAGVLPHPFRQGLARAVRGDGFISFDLIADAGALGGVEPTVSLMSPDGSQVEFTEAAPAPEDAVDLGDGRELVRFTIPIGAFGALTAEVYTGLGFGFTYDSPSPVVLHIDNVMAEFAFADATTTRLTFADDREGFEIRDADDVLLWERTEDPGNMALLFIGSAGRVLQTEATFQTDDIADRPRHFATGLAQAANSGGELSFEVIFDEDSARSTDGTFDGISVIMAIEGGGELREREFVFDDIDFPLASGETATRTVEVPLYPSGSSESDGFVIEPDTAYKVSIGSNTVAGSASSIEVFIDDLAVTSATVPHPPMILGEPKLDLSGETVSGRLLAAFAEDAAYSATGLPPGVSIDPDTGLISGTPTSDGSYSVSLSVVTAGGTAEADYEWTVAGAGTAEALTIVSFSRSEGSFTINWNGDGGNAVDIQRSTDLSTWETIATGVGGSSFTDDEAPEDRAFYRVVRP